MWNRTCRTNDSQYLVGLCLLLLQVCVCACVCVYIYMHEYFWMYVYVTCVSVYVQLYFSLFRGHIKLHRCVLWLISSHGLSLLISTNLPLLMNVQLPMLHLPRLNNYNAIQFNTLHYTKLYFAVSADCRDDRLLSEAAAAAVGGVMPENLSPSQRSANIPLTHSLTHWINKYESINMNQWINGWFTDWLTDWLNVWPKSKNLLYSNSISQNLNNGHKYTYIHTMLILTLLSFFSTHVCQSTHSLSYPIAFHF